jgi:hypothetical protein
MKVPATGFLLSGHEVKKIKGNDAGSAAYAARFKSGGGPGANANENQAARVAFKSGGGSAPYAEGS